MAGNKEVELKGGMYTFMSLKLRTLDLDSIDKQLADKVQQAPGFFKDTPLVVDLTEIEAMSDENADFDTADLIKRIQSHQLQPIVVSVDDKSSPFASAIALPLIEAGTKRKKPVEKVDKTAETETTDKEPDVDLSTTGQQVEMVIKAPLLITKPVRSGQQVYASDTDLIVMGQIGPGAEVIADNNIHVYGPLRGRALCGVSGNTETRIFCQSLEAELVSVAGNYRVLEEIPEDLRGKPAQIWLDNDRLRIEPL